MSDYFDASSNRVSSGVTARASDVNTLRDDVGTGFDKLPSDANITYGTTYYNSGGGSADAYTVTLDMTPTAYTDGMVVVFKAAAANTGASTLNVNSLGVKSIKRRDGAALAAGDIQADKFVECRYNSTSGNFEIQALLSGEMTDITTVSDNISDVSAVAAIDANVTTVAGISSDVTTVAGDSTDIQALGPISSDIQTLADIEDGTDATDAIQTTAANASDITTVAAIDSDVSSVAGVSGDVSSVASLVVGWSFDSSTSMADPGAGDLRLDNATVASATNIAVSATDSASVDVSAWVATWDDQSSNVRGTLVIRKGGDAATFAVFDVTGAITDNGAWLQIPVTYVTGNGSLSGGDALYIGFARTGDQGFTAPGSTTDNAIVRWDGTDGSAVQDSGVTVDDSDNVAGVNDLDIGGELEITSTSPSMRWTESDQTDRNYRIVVGGGDLKFQQIQDDGTLISEIGEFEYAKSQWQFNKETSFKNECVQVQGDSTPPDGVGLEFRWTGTAAEIWAYDRNNTTYEPLNFYGTEFVFKNSPIKISDTGNADIEFDCDTDASHTGNYKWRITARESGNELYIQNVTGASYPWYFDTDDGFVANNATGGSQGAGTINAVAVYDDGSLLTDYVFDAAIDGHIDTAFWDAQVPNRTRTQPSKTKFRTEYRPATKKVQEARLVFDERQGAFVRTAVEREVEQKAFVPIMDEQGRRVGTKWGPKVAAVQVPELEEVEEVREHRPARSFPLDDLDPREYAKKWRASRKLPAMERLPASKAAVGEMVQALVETCEVQAVHVDKLQQQVDKLQQQVDKLHAAQIEVNDGTTP